MESAWRPLTLLALFAATLWTVLYLQFTVDDAYISFRYGKIFASQHLWNWNPSGEPVYAYTSAVYAWLSVISAVLHLPVALFFKCFGLLCIGGMLYRLQCLTKGRFAFTLGVLCLGLTPWLWIHAFSGLETPLYMFLLLETALCVQDAPSARPPYACALFLVLPLTRPEGIVFALAGAVLFWSRCKPARGYFPWLGLAACLGALYVWASWKYFGQPLPNPFYVKVVHSSWHDRSTWHDLLQNLTLNIRESFVGLLILILLPAIARNTVVRIFGLCALLLMLFLFAPHVTVMNYASRFCFQMAFPLVLLFLITEDTLRFPRIACALAALAVFSAGAHGFGFRTYFPALQQGHIDLGKRLAPYSSGHTMLLGDDGAIPYFANWLAYDSLGLCTNSIAHTGVTPAFLQQTQPDLIIVNSRMIGPDDPQAAVLEYVRSSGQYEYAATMQWRNIPFDEYLKKDTKQHQEILNALQQNANHSAPLRFSWKKLLLQQYVPWSE